MSKGFIVFMVLFVGIVAGGTYFNMNQSIQLDAGDDSQVHVVSLSSEEEEEEKPVPVGTFKETTLESLDEVNRNFAKAVINEWQALVTHDDLIIFSLGKMPNGASLKLVRQEGNSSTEELKLYVKIDQSETDSSDDNQGVSHPYIVGKVPYADKLKIEVYDSETGKPLF